MAKVATKYLDVDPWVVREKGFHKSRARVSESLFALGNEFMGVRGYFDEGFSGETERGSFFNGIFEDEDTIHPAPHIGMADRCHFMANSVDWLYARIVVDREQLDLATSKVSQFERVLNMRDGTLYRSLVWTTKKGKKLRLIFDRFTSMADPNLGAQRITIEPLNFSGTVNLTMGLDFNPVQHTRDDRKVWPTVQTRTSGKMLATVGQIKRTGHRVFSSMRLNAPKGVKPVLAKADRTIAYDMKLAMREGEAMSFDKIVVNATEKNTRVQMATFWKRGLELARKHAKCTYDGALEKHMAYWHDQWAKLDIVIEGSDEDQQAARFCIYHLNQIKHGVDPDLNIAAKGLSGEDYEGHTWWDTETYCLPFYLFNNPKAARDLIVWRHTRLPQARERARQKDCVGACYPMDTIDGTESSRSWQNGDLEIHVPAAVAFAIWHYELITQDTELVYNEGIEILLEVSRYYASRGAYRQDGKFGFWCVVGPDEFHFAVNNNYYTNVFAKKTFEYTLKVMDEMKKNAPAKLKAVCKKLGLDAAEPKAWKAMANKMILPKDEATGLFEQFESYFDMPSLDLDAIDPADFPLIKHWCYYRVFRWDMIKQPDTLLALFLYSHDYTMAEKLANYEYYEPRCIHESSLSPAIHSMLAAEVGKADEASRYWSHAARLDLDDYNRNTNAGLHTTSMAATWMNVIYGFGGMRSDGKRLSFDPNMPTMWKAFTFKILYRGSVLEVSISKTGASFRVAEGKAVTVDIYGKATKVGAEPVSVKLQAKK
jgi:maltose phosphorylase